MHTRLDDDATTASYNRWLQQRSLADTTQRIYLHVLVRFTDWLVYHHDADHPLHATRAQIKDWRAQLNVSDSSILTYVAALRSFYRWAGLEELIPSDPTLGLPLPRPPRRLPRPIGEEPLEVAIDNARERIRPWLILAAYAGLRACEIATLHRSRIVETAEDPYMIVVGKGGKERVVFLSDYVLSELLPLLPRRGYVFLRMDGRFGHVPEKIVSQLANAHLRACGIGATIHQLRHRAGTMLQREGKDLRLTQEILGHSDPKTTSGYAQISNPAAVAAMQAIQPKGRRLRSARNRSRRNSG